MKPPTMATDTTDTTDTTETGTGPTGSMGSGAMFDGIARRYDLVNRVMSLGLDLRWRRALVEALLAVTPAEGELLDVATGTADVALALAAAAPGVRVRGLDPSEQMLAYGRQKVAESGLSGRITLDLGDGQALPYENDRFDAACVSFGIRNFPDRLAGLRELARVTRAGGRVAILELAEPRGAGLLGRAARAHVRHVVPRIGGLLSGSREYRYLQRSIAAFPPAEEFVALMQAAGLQRVVARPMTLGAVVLFVGEVGEVGEVGATGGA